MLGMDLGLENIRVATDVLETIDTWVWLRADRGRAIEHAESSSITARFRGVAFASHAAVTLGHLGGGICETACAVALLGVLGSGPLEAFG